MYNLKWKSSRNFDSPPPPTSSPCLVGQRARVPSRAPRPPHPQPAFPPWNWVGEPSAKPSTWLRTRVGGIWAEAAPGRVGIESPEPERGKQGPGYRPASEARVLRGVLPGATPRAVGGHPTGRTRSPSPPPPPPSAQRPKPEPESLGRARGPEWIGVVESGNRPSPGARGWGGNGFPFPGRAGTTVGPPSRTRECSLNKGKSPRHPGTARSLQLFLHETNFTHTRAFSERLPRAKRRVCKGKIANTGNKAGVGAHKGRQPGRRGDPRADVSSTRGARGEGPAGFRRVAGGTLYIHTYIHIHTYNFVF